MEYLLELDGDLPVLPALIWAEEIAPPRPTAAVPSFLREVIETARDRGEDAIPAELRRRVRRMLRYGKYRPSGRGKPASEFLLRAALQESSPRQLSGRCEQRDQSRLRPSRLDLRLRYHRTPAPPAPRPAGERYVFNRSGQEIDLEDLLLVCRQTEAGWTPCGNPVKDAMETKITTTTRNVIAVLYAPMDEPVERLTMWAARYAELLRSECGAAQAGYEVIKGTS